MDRSAVNLSCNFLNTWHMAIQSYTCTDLIEEKKKKTEIGSVIVAFMLISRWRKTGRAFEINACG